MDVPCSLPLFRSPHHVFKRKETRMNEYERLRMENITKNNDFLERLGLNENVISKNKNTSKRKKPASLGFISKRTSARLSMEPIVSIAIQESIIEEITEEEFDDSSVFRYNVGEISELHIQSDCGRLYSCGTSWTDNSLKKIYCVDWHRNNELFVAAGHGGQVAVFGSNVADPLMSFKSSRGWCSAAQFLGTTKDHEILLLTASNDGSLTLWDATKQSKASGRAKEVASTNDLHGGGIFSMHEFEGVVVSGSKDKTVAISHVTEDGCLKVLDTYDSLHSGVVKSVRLWDTNVFVSTGNDMCIKLVDRRAGKKEQVCIEDADHLSINSVRWIESNSIVAASFAPHMRIWDLRKTLKPKLELKAHNPGVSRCKAIYHPLLINNRKQIVVAGNCSDIVTIFSTDTGNVISKGTVGFQTSCLGASSTNKILAAHSKYIDLLKVK